MSAKNSEGVKGVQEAKDAESMERARTAKSVNRTYNAQQAQEAAFEAAFQEHWGRVVGVLQGLLGESGVAGEAEDLALEAFYRMHQNPLLLDSRDSLRGWLYRVATHLGLNALRARKRRKRYEEQAGVLDLQEQPGGDPAHELERLQDRQRVRFVLAEMKPRSAQLLLLRHSGCSYAELAAALKIAPGSVGTLLARAEGEFEKKYRKLSKGESNAPE